MASGVDPTLDPTSAGATYVPPAGTTYAPQPTATPPSATEAAQQEALALRDRAADAAAAVGHTATDELGALKDEAVEDARHLADEARERVGAEADRAATEVAGALAEAAHELRTMAAHAEHPDSPVAEVVRRAGQRAEATARRLEQRGSQGVVDDLSRFARNRPGLFLLGAGALGFAVGRMVRNTDTGSIIDAAKGELTGSSPSGDDARPPMDRPERAAIDLRTLQSGVGPGTLVGPSGGMPAPGGVRP